MSAMKELFDRLLEADQNGKLPEEIPYQAAWMELTHAINDVLDERKRQDAKWGEQNHNPFIYYAIVGEEFGELGEALLQTKFGGPKGGFDNIRKEAIHTAATALALIECLDRGKYPKLFSIDQM